jgi:hypothetical protein
MWFREEVEDKYLEAMMLVAMIFRRIPENQENNVFLC